MVYCSVSRVTTLWRLSVMGRRYVSVHSLLFSIKSHHFMATVGNGLPLCFCSWFTVQINVYRESSFFLLLLFFLRRLLARGRRYVSVHGLQFRLMCIDYSPSLRRLALIYPYVVDWVHSINKLTLRRLSAWGCRSVSVRVYCSDEHVSRVLYRLPYGDCQQRVASLFPFMFYCSGKRASSVPTLRGLSLSKGSPVCFHSCFTVQVNLCRESPLHDDCQQRVASLFPFMFYCSGKRVSSVPTLRGLSLSKGSPVCFHSCFTVQVNMGRESPLYVDCQQRVASLFPFMFYCSGKRVSRVLTLRRLSRWG